MKKFSLVLMFALSACGGSGGAYDAGGTPPMATPSAAPPPSKTDAFITAVLALLGTSDDSAEPAAIDAVAATAPDDGEPAPVQ